MNKDKIVLTTVSVIGVFILLFGIMSLRADKTYNYEWFKQQKVSIDSLMSKKTVALSTVTNYMTFLRKRCKVVKPTRAQGSNYTRELHILLDTYDRIRHQTHNAVTEYNMRSKTVSRNIFKHNLPVTIKKGLISRENT